jgi:hypothetical protein
VQAKPICEGTGDVKFIDPIERTERIYLLPGDIRLSNFEEELASLWQDCFHRKARGFKEQRR